MMWGNGHAMGWLMWLILGVGTLAFWIVIILLVRALLPSRTQRVEAPPRPDPLTLLKESLARGDVSIEEYEQRRRLLSDDG